MLKGIEKKDRKYMMKMMGRMEGNMVLRGEERRVLRMRRKKKRRKMKRRNENVILKESRKGLKLND